MRHGSVQMDSLGDLLISERGQSEIKEASQAFSQENRTFSQVFTSEKTRCIQTAEFFLKNLGVNAPLRTEKIFSPKDQIFQTEWDNWLASISLNSLIVTHFPNLEALFYEIWKIKEPSDSLKPSCLFALVFQNEELSSYRKIY